MTDPLLHLFLTDPATVSELAELCDVTIDLTDRTLVVKGDTADAFVNGIQETARRIRRVDLAVASSPVVCAAVALVFNKERCRCLAWYHGDVRCTPPSRGNRATRSTSSKSSRTARASR